VKKGNKTTRYVGELIPPYLVIARFFKEEEAEVDRLAAETETATQAKAEFEEEHGGEDGALSSVDSGRNGIPKGNVQNRVMELKEVALDAIPMYTPEYEQARAIKRSSFGTAPWEKGVQDDGDIFAELDLLHDYLPPRLSGDALDSSRWHHACVVESKDSQSDERVGKEHREPCTPE
jgi:type I restriction enzyme M protein